jgi:arylsulfatase A-like enzyme
MKRRTFLKTALAAAGSAPWFNILASVPAKYPPNGRPMNILFIMTDQERDIQHFPRDWARRYLPSRTLMQRNGLTFTRAYTAACMCSPSRASIMTGLFPAQHQVKDTLTEGTNYSDSEQWLPLNLPNMGTVMGAAGYEVIYKGKWHLTKPPKDRSGPDGVPDGQITAEYDFVPGDIVPWGFHKWDPPDAGESTALYQFGGGKADNDRRFVSGAGGAIDYLKGVARRSAASRQPFCMFLSLVNPHDLLSYPNSYIAGGYSNQWLKGDIALPPTWNEDLSTKPTAQRAQRATLNAGLGVLQDRQMRLNYLNFYGNLMRRVDLQILAVYRTLKQQGLLDNTLIIRTADHGEMGLAHGGLRQKNFNFYEETTRVPLIYSNPVLFPAPVTRDTLVSHVDLLPTLGALANSPVQAGYWQGRDYSALIRNPRSAPSPQDYVVFTFDDIRAGQNLPAVSPPPNRIMSIREGRYKLARYYDGRGILPDQWEMYDTQNDPLELRNLAWPTVATTAAQRKERARLEAKLQKVADTRLKPLSRGLVPKPVDS